MKEIVHKLMKRSVRRIVAMVLIVTMVFGVLPAGMFPDGIIRHAKAADYKIMVSSTGEKYEDNASYDLTKKEDTLTLQYLDNAGVGTGNYATWEIEDESIATSSSIGGEQRNELHIKAVGIGKTWVHAAVFARGENGTTTNITYISIQVVVPAVLEEERHVGNGTAGNGKNNTASMIKVHAEDKHMSIIMDERASWPIGDDPDAPDQINKLNLFVGNASELEWSSGDENVVRCNLEAQEKSIYAAGAGHTKLRGTPVGADVDPVVVDVYVRPEIEISSKKDRFFIEEQLPVETGTYISFPNVKLPAPLSLKDRLAYVVAYQDSDSQYKFLFDSEGTGPAPDDTTAEMIMKDNSVKLTPLPSYGNNQSPGYLFEAKAGQYYIAFFPKDLYQKDLGIGWCNEHTTWGSNFTARVNSKFENKTILLNVNGRYNLADGLNILKDLLSKDFSFQPAGSDGSSSTNCISFDGNNLIVTAKEIGTATLTITRTNPGATIPKPGGVATGGAVSGGAASGGAVSGGAVTGGATIVPNDSITITFIVGNSFALNTPSMTLAVGETTSLMGMLNGLVDFPPSSKFEWKAENTNVKIDGVDSLATITGMNEGTSRVTLYWTDTDGITQVATCIVNVVPTTIPIQLSDTELILNSGDTKEISVVNYVTNTELLWISSNESIAKVEPISDRRAMITAGEETGEAYITVINTKNNQIAVCKVTVRRNVAELKIGVAGKAIEENEEYEVAVTQGFLQLEAIFTPENATNADFVWTSGDKNIAEIDKDTGLLKLLKTGTVRIYVETLDKTISGSCYIKVTNVPLEGITLPETKITMVVGDTYQVVPTLTPENPTNPNLTWTSSDPTIAKVDDKGVITAVKAGGPISVMVTGSDGKMASMVVTVLNKLNTISFDKTEVELEIGETCELGVIFSPDADVNTNITFSSTNSSIVKVDDKGVLTALSEGMAMVIATAEELGIPGAITCLVRVLPKTIHVQEFTVDPPEMQLLVGEEQKITPIYKPENTTHQDVVFTAGNEAVATVTEEGLVKGVAPGFTIITCEDVFTGEVAICQVTVVAGVKFSLSPASREIAIGKSFTLKKVIEPALDLTDPDIEEKEATTWESSNKAIASVNSSGKVTGKKLGTCVITATLDYYGARAACRVTVAKLKSKVKLNKTSIRMNLGSTYKLKATVTSNDSKLPSVKFTSKNTKIAKVNSKSGNIKARSVGSTYVVATVQDATNATARCRVTVIRRATSISLNKTYAVCYIGSSLKLKATVKPSNATIKQISWSSSDKKIGVVNGSGKVTGYAEGETYITAKTTDGSNKKAQCLVKVKEPIETSSILVAQRDLTLRVGDTTTLSYTVLPSDHTDTIKMASDNKRVATVTNSGTVKAVGTGNATITIMSTSGVTATVNINVVALNKSSVRIRQYDTETLIVHGTSDPITWYSGNNSIATVTNGRVVGRNIGTTYVYAYVNGCRMSCRIEVVRIK